jgi:hypothetical protein
MQIKFFFLLKEDGYIKVEISKIKEKKSICNNSTWQYLQEINVSLDEFSSTGSNAILENFEMEQSVEGEIHIVLHPSFNTLYPFIRLWHNNGCLLELSETQDILYRIDGSVKAIDGNENVCINHFKNNSFGGNYISNMDNNSIKIKMDDIQFQLVHDVHPVLDVPYYSMHLCNLNEKIFDIIENNNVHKNERNLAENYLLVWFSHVGKYLGLKTITAMDFQLISKNLFLDCNCEGNSQ